jgi:hypothetical protein
MKWLVIVRTADGRHCVESAFDSQKEAIEHLIRAAEDCRASNHRRIDLDIENRFLSPLTLAMMQ